MEPSRPAGACVFETALHYEGVSAEQSPPKKRGCFFYGCLSLIIVSVAGVLVGYLAIRHVINWLVADYTESKPALIESIEVSSAQREDLQRRIAEFVDVLQSQKTAQELRLTSDDLNVLIATEPKMKDLKDRVFLTIEDERIRGNVSIPLEKLGSRNFDLGIWRKLKGRYLNGTAEFKASLETNHLLVTVENLQVKGRPLPTKFLAQVRQWNLAEDAQHDTNTARWIQKFESIRVTNSLVILKNKVRN
jgi:hypothetical protein